jgi:hypothetical protein
MHDPMIDESELAELDEMPDSAPWWIGDTTFISLGLAWCVTAFYRRSIFGICLGLLFLGNVLRLFFKRLSSRRNAALGIKMQLELMPLLSLPGVMGKDFNFREIISTTDRERLEIHHYTNIHSGRSLFVSIGGRCWEWQDTSDGHRTAVEIDPARAVARLYE